MKRITNEELNALAVLLGGESGIVGKNYKCNGIAVYDKSIKGRSGLKMTRSLIQFQIECKPVHYQPLVDMGVRMDFSEKRVGFQSNQNHCSGTGNTSRIKCHCTWEVFEKVNAFVRDTHCHTFNLMNDQCLKRAGFPFSNRIAAGIKAV